MDLTMLTRIPGERKQVTRLSQDSLNLAKPVARLEIWKSFFSRRVIDLWNSLPHDVKHAKKFSKV